MLLPAPEERDLIPPSSHCQAHGGTVLCVAEIGMYRCSKSDHVARMNEEEERLARTATTGSETERMLRQHFAHEIWTPWRYNQVVGWLRVYAYPRKTQHGTPCVGGEYFAIDAKCLSKNLKRKRFLWAGRAFDLPFEGKLQAHRAFDQVSQEIQRWAKTDPIRNLSLDLTVWNNVGPHIDWTAILLPEVTGSSVKKAPRQPALSV